MNTEECLMRFRLGLRELDAPAAELIFDREGGDA